MNEKEKPKTEAVDAENALMWAIGFIQEDLNANRDGRLSKIQRDQIASQMFRWMGIAILATLVILWSVLNAAGRINSAIEQGGIVWSIVASVAGFAWCMWKQFYDEIRAPEIGAVQGRVELGFQNSKNATALTLTIQGMRFNIKQNVFLAFTNGDSYAIYYAPYSKTLLSAEWLREG